MTTPQRATLPVDELPYFRTLSQPLRHALEAVNRLSVAMTLKLISVSKRLRNDFVAPPKGELFVSPDSNGAVILNVKVAGKKNKISEEVLAIGQECFEELALGGIAMARAGKGTDSAIPSVLKKNQLIKKLTKAQRQLLYTGCRAAHLEHEVEKEPDTAVKKLKTTSATESPNHECRGLESTEFGSDADSCEESEGDGEDESEEEEEDEEETERERLEREMEEMHEEEEAEFEAAVDYLEKALQLPRSQRDREVFQEMKDLFNGTIAEDRKLRKYHCDLDCALYDDEEMGSEDEEEEEEYDCSEAYDYDDASVESCLEEGSEEDAPSESPSPCCEDDCDDPESDEVLIKFLKTLP